MSKAAYLFLLLLVCFGCKKQQGSKPPVDPFYFKGKINGQSVEWIAPFNNSITGGTIQYKTTVIAPENAVNPLQNCSPTDLPYQYFEGCQIYEFNGTDIDPSKNVLQVAFALQTNDRLSAPSLRSWFTNGPKNFGLARVNCSDQGENGVVIFYRDATGKWWFTTKETGSISQFTQLALEDETRDKATHLKKWKVQFSCKLSDGNGNQITLSDCELYVPVFRP